MDQFAPGAASLKKPPRERLRESADRLFRERGASVSLREIAHDAGTREETAEKLYGDINGLLHVYVADLVSKAHSLWKEAKVDEPPSRDTYALVMHFEQVLKTWAKLAQREFRSANSSFQQLVRILAQLLGDAHSPIVARINSLFATERDLIFRLCRDGPFRDEEELAHHFILLVHGARNEPQQFYASARKLSFFVDNLLHAYHIEPDKEDL